MFALEHDLDDIKSKILAMPDNTNADGDNQTVCECKFYSLCKFIFYCLIVRSFLLGTIDALEGL